MAENKSKSGSRGSSLKRLLHRSSTGKRNVINREKSIERYRKIHAHHLFEPWPILYLCMQA